MRRKENIARKERELLCEKPECGLCPFPPCSKSFVDKCTAIAHERRYYDSGKESKPRADRRRSRSKKARHYLRAAARKTLRRKAGVKDGSRAGKAAPGMGKAKERESEGEE